MKKPTPEQLKAICANYKELRAKVTRAGGLVLQMARHPDMTDAMLLEVVARYRRCYQGLRDVHDSCKKLDVPYRVYTPYPWETPL